MSFNHMFDVAFIVPDSIHEDPEDCILHEWGKIAQSMRNRIRQLANEFEREGIDPVDTYENLDHVVFDQTEIDNEKDQ